MRKSIVFLCSFLLLSLISPCDNEARAMGMATGADIRIKIQERWKGEKIWLWDVASYVNKKMTVREVSEMPSAWVPSPAEPVSPPPVGEERQVYQIQIAVNGQAFAATLFQNETTDVLMERFPLTLDMGDMNGNEKYYYLPDPLPVNAEKPSEIHSGDFMLYGTDCLVLFYEDFSSSYSYTPLGYVEDVGGLAAALGSGTVQVSFRAE